VTVRLVGSLPNNMTRLPLDFFLACRRHGVIVTRLVLCVNVAKQSAVLLEKLQGRARPPAGPCGPCGPCGAPASNGYRVIHACRCSTSRFGIGQVCGSNRTPLGLHRIAEKIGGGRPVGTVFRSRQAAGFTWHGQPGATITSRILWLDGLEPGFNRGGNVDSHARYIYIHGTGDEPALGRPASCGCIHLAADDLLPLFDMVPVGTLVWIYHHPDGRHDAAPTPHARGVRCITGTPRS